MASIFSITDWLIPELEGFLAHPKWDAKQYSWGYGTKAPGPTGTITKAQALSDARDYLQADYAALRPLITRPLSPQQWAAYLSFAYNVGKGNTSTGAKALVADINANDDSVLEPHWKRYIYSEGVVSQDLVNRRNREWGLWTS